MSQPHAPDDDALTAILTRVRTIAMIGASTDTRRASHTVMRFLQSAGYRVIPVNPDHLGAILHGESVVGHIRDVGEPVDMVDIFRRSDFAGGHVDEALAEKDRLGVSVIWMQLSVIDEAAAERARAAGIDVVMNRYPAIEHPRLIGG